MTAAAVAATPTREMVHPRRSPLHSIPRPSASSATATPPVPVEDRHGGAEPDDGRPAAVAARERTAGGRLGESDPPH